MHIKVFPKLALVLSSVSLVACNAPPLIDLSLYGPVQCQERMVSLAAFKTARPFDYLELRAVSWSEGEGEGEDAPAEEVRIGSIGQKCATATDRAACESAVASAKVRTGFAHGTALGIPCCTVHYAYYLVATSSDTVEVIDRLDTLREFFGTIDTPEEAAFFVRGYDGEYRVDCQHSVRAADGGFEVALSIPATCYGDGTRRVSHVTSAGVVTNVMLERFKYEGSCHQDPNSAI